MENLEQDEELDEMIARIFEGQTLTYPPGEAGQSQQTENKAGQERSLDHKAVEYPLVRRPRGMI